MASRVHPHKCGVPDPASEGTWRETWLTLRKYWVDKEGVPGKQKFSRSIGGAIKEHRARRKAI